MNSPRTLKLMADYACFPIWYDGSDPDLVGNIDPASLPISAGLVADLLAWSQRLDDSLDWDDPGGTVWPDGFWLSFNGEGRALAARLRSELGPAFSVREHHIGEDLA